MTSLLPYNATPVEQAIEGATARDVPVPLRDLWNPSTCAIELLPWLAWALSIDNWDSNWPEAVKRERVRTAIAIQRRKGTSASVRDAVASFGGAVAIREWWETTPPGTPHTFDLTLYAGLADFVSQVVAEVDRTKPARSHYTFTQALAGSGGIGVFAVGRPCVYARLNATAAAA